MINPSEMIPQKKLDNGQWWNLPWSLVDGCTRVSTGCDNCWLTAVNERFGRVPEKVTPREDRLTIPLKRRKPTVYTIWSDLFHEAVPDSFIDKAFAVMALCPQHLFIVLTKRPERMAEYYASVAERTPCIIGEVMVAISGSSGPGYEWPLPNLWIYASAENQKQFDLRWPYLARCPAVVRGMSLSLLLGPIDLAGGRDGGLEIYMGDLDGPVTTNIHHIITECESGPKRRPCDWEWVCNIIQQCDAAGVPVWTKQMSIGGKVSHDMSSEGGWPEWARRREFPT